MIVREGQRGDFPAIRAVSLATGQPEMDSGADPEYVAFVRDTGTMLVAIEPGGALVGWGATRPSMAGSMLTDLFVDPTRQGAGVGARILAALWPREREADQRFTFSSRHPSALPLYAKAGLLPRWPLLYLSGTSVPTGPRQDLDASRVTGVAAADAEM